MHDDQPDAWRPQQRVVLLVHGLCGSHRSGYLVRIARQLNQRGVRTFRLDMRGCGAGLALAHHPYHSGRSDDIRQALKYLSERCAGSPLTLLAFSLSANTALKMLGESEALPTALDQAIVVSPPVDLARCVASLANYPARAIWADDDDRYVYRVQNTVDIGAKRVRLRGVHC
jgi:predicted alpha/beta-fold hydrolase